MTVRTRSPSRIRITLYQPAPAQARVRFILGLGVSVLERWLNKAEDVAIRISDVELGTVGHLAQRHNQRHSRRLKAGRKRLRVLGDNAGVYVFGTLKRGLVTRRGRSAIEVDVTTIAADIA